MSKNIYIIRIALDGSKPPVWRRVSVESDVTLAQLHDIIQIVMGWTDSHLHHFILRDKSLKLTSKEIFRQNPDKIWDTAFIDRMRGERIFVQKTNPWGEPTEMEGEDEKAVTLAEVCPQVKSKLMYEYDFGDSWIHEIKVEKISEPEPNVYYPICLDGKMACPPEDCGGVWGYYEMLEAIADSNHENHEDIMEWLGDEFDPDEFDLEAINDDLAQWRKENEHRGKKRKRKQ
ncbi:MAG: plasmid pRiA4b ORF-3 family protein [Sedimentisphaerales bacterium]|nr:plasmid pRiA4b ORF-3 family protein [Sedimentisphaerales bacterium]